MHFYVLKKIRKTIGHLVAYVHKCYVGYSYYTWRFAGFLICRGKRQILLICRGKKRQKRKMYITTLSDNKIREFLAGEPYKNIQFSIIIKKCHSGFRKMVPGIRIFEIVKINKLLSTLENNRLKANTKFFYCISRWIVPVRGNNFSEKSGFRELVFPESGMTFLNSFFDGEQKLLLSFFDCIDFCLYSQT